MKIQMHHQKLTFSRHNILAPSLAARLDQEQLESSKTMARLEMSGLIDKEQLHCSKPGPRQSRQNLIDREQQGETSGIHGQGLSVPRKATEKRRHSDQGVMVSGVGSGSRVIERSLSAPGNGRRGSNLGLIACLDEEQRRGMPSSSEIWRKQKMTEAENTGFLCPCLTRLLEEQVEENRRIQYSSQNTLTYVGIGSS